MSWPLIVALVVFSPVLAYVLMVAGCIILLVVTGPWLLLGTVIGTERSKQCCHNILGTVHAEPEVDRRDRTRSNIRDYLPRRVRREEGK